MMNWLPWILVVAMGYEVQCQAYSDRKNRGDGPRGFPGLFCFYNNRNYMAGQSFPSNDGCNTCTCNGHNRVTCTERACFPNPSEEPVCRGRKQLPNRRCGGFMGRPCPRNYECVGHLLPIDGPGVCCRKDPGPSISVCPRIPHNTMGICVERCSSDRDCPRGQLCCSNGCGHVCMRAESGWRRGIGERKRSW